MAGIATTSSRAAFLALAAWGAGRAGAGEAPPALSTPVAFHVERGPLADALRAVEAQLGVRFAFLPELLPDDPVVEPFSHRGPLSAGLDRLIGGGAARWALGACGGIAVVPRDRAPTSHGAWIRDHFPDAGAELLELTESGERLGLKKGDILVAVQGERFSSPQAFHAALQAWVTRDEPVVYTLARGNESFDVKAVIHANRSMAWLDALARRCLEAPSVWSRYQKDGHRDPAWDSEFKAVCDEYVRLDAGGDARGLQRLAGACAERGCRDPLMAYMLLDRARGFGTAAWDLFERILDPRTLRRAYGGSCIDFRARLAAAFVGQGSASVRDAALRRVECAEAWLRTHPNAPLRQDAIYALACRQFIAGEVDGCIRLMESIREDLLRRPAPTRAKLLSQALLRQGRVQEALAAHKAFAAAFPIESEALYTNLLARQEGFPPTPESRMAGRLDGPVSLLGWKAVSAVKAIEVRAEGKPPTEEQLLSRPVSNFGIQFYPSMLPKVPRHLEAHVFPRLATSHSGMDALAGVVFGGAVNHDRTGGYCCYHGVQYNVSSSLTLRRFHVDAHGEDAANRDGDHHRCLSSAIPLPGFANDGRDTLRIVMMPDVATVWVNGTWLSADVSAGNRAEGEFMLLLQNGDANIDCGLFAPADRCRDNDRIRELIERLCDPRVRLNFEESAKLFLDAEALAPRDNLFRHALRLLKSKFLKRMPPFQERADTEALRPLAAEEAEARFLQRGPARWIRPDPRAPDALWCARPDGTIEIMSRVRYWTDTHRNVRDEAGRGVAIGEPLFEPDAVWLPTDRGLFLYDRLQAAFRRLPLGGLFHDVPIQAVRREGQRVRVEPAGLAAGGVWRFESKTGTGSRE